MIAHEMDARIGQPHGATWKWPGCLSGLSKGGRILRLFRFPGRQVLYGSINISADQSGGGRPAEMLQDRSLSDLIGMSQQTFFQKDITVTACAGFRPFPDARRKRKYHDRFLKFLSVGVTGKYTGFRETLRANGQAHPILSGLCRADSLARDEGFTPRRPADVAKGVRQFLRLRKELFQRILLCHSSSSDIPARCFVPFSRSQGGDWRSVHDPERTVAGWYILIRMER